MTEIVFNDGDHDYAVSRIRIVDNGEGVIRLWIYPERNSTKAYVITAKAMYPQ